MDEKNANEIFTEERWNNFQNALKQGDTDMCEAIVKEARGRGFDRLADEMTVDLRKLLEVESD